MVASEVEARVHGHTALPDGLGAAPLLHAKARVVHGGSEPLVAEPGTERVALLP